MLGLLCLAYCVIVIKGIQNTQHSQGAGIQAQLVGHLIEGRGIVVSGHSNLWSIAMIA